MRALKFFIKISILCLFMCVNVSIKASEAMPADEMAHESRYVQEPYGCLQNENLVCGIKTKKKFADFTYKQTEFHLAKETVLIRVGPETWYLSQGSVWIKSLGNVFLKTKWGSVSAENESSVLIEADAAEVKVTPLEFSALVQPAGGDILYELPVGSMVALEGRSHSGAGFLRMTRSPNPKSLFMKWGELYQGRVQKFANLTDQYRKRWDVEARRIAEFQKEVYQREVASANEKERLRQLRIQRYRAESKRLRGLFKKKTYY